MNKEEKELLGWELSLESCDIRAHAWYHGSITRQRAEALLVCNGDFLVRDCSSSGRPGDYVLSCRWDDTNIHFLIHKDVFQKDTIYEALRYKFENESFDTVPDLIRYHVGSEIEISAGSEAVISNPVNRTIPLLKAVRRILVSDNVRSDYVSLMACGNDSLQQSFHSDKVSTLERAKQKTLMLEPPPGLLEELNDVPHKLICSPRKPLNDSNEEDIAVEEKTVKQSNFDLTEFQSILLPTNTDISPRDKHIIKNVTDRMLESSDRSIALTITGEDWKALTAANRSNSGSECSTPEGTGTSNILRDNRKSEIYTLFLQDSQHRWNNVIERSLTFSHFVVITVLLADNPEEVMNKWIGIASELKSFIGNFFSFCSIMRGLLMPQLARCDGTVDWMKLRQKYTQSAFNFETCLRGAYQGYVRGTESYPPNTTIPELFSAALILEDALDMLPLSCINAEDEQLEFYYSHLEELRTLTTWSDIQGRNIQRFLAEVKKDAVEDMLLNDIFRAEFQLLLLWAHGYPEKSLKERCAQINFISG